MVLLHDLWLRVVMKFNCMLARSTLRLKFDWSCDIHFHMAGKSLLAIGVRLKGASIEQLVYPQTW